MGLLTGLFLGSAGAQVGTQAGLGLVWASSRPNLRAHLSPSLEQFFRLFGDLFWHCSGPILAQVGIFLELIWASV